MLKLFLLVLQVYISTIQGQCIQGSEIKVVNNITSYLNFEETLKLLKYPWKMINLNF